MLARSAIGPYNSDAQRQWAYRYRSMKISHFQPMYWQTINIKCGPEISNNASCLNWKEYKEVFNVVLVYFSFASSSLRPSEYFHFPSHIKVEWASDRTFFNRCAAFWVSRLLHIKTFPNNRLEHTGECTLIFSKGILWTWRFSLFIIFGGQVDCDQCKAKPMSWKQLLKSSQCLSECSKRKQVLYPLAPSYDLKQPEANGWHDYMASLLHYLSKCRPFF